MRLVLALLALFGLTPAVSAAGLLDRLPDAGIAPYVIQGRGFVTDAGHPNHPGDFRTHALRVQLHVNPEMGETALAFDSGEGDAKSTDRYFVRRGRVFQVDDQGAEIVPEPLGDLAPGTVAALHPAIVANALRERSEAFHPDGRHSRFAWNDALWTLDADAKSGRLRGLARRTVHDVFGDGTEAVRYDPWGKSPSEAGRVTVTAGGRIIAQLEFDAGAPASSPPPPFPAADHRRDPTRLVAASDIVLQETAPHVYRIDLAALNTRVVVVEFTDHVAVLEGAYTSRNCDRIAAVVQAKLGKPVRWFAFSHLHGQYVGGVRSWIHAGATVLVPPSTAPLIQDIARAPFELRHDALAGDSRPLRLETIEKTRTFEDAMNTLQVFNVESGHTDEYFLFWLPRQKILLSGDLLFYRPGKPLAGRSKLLAETVRKLGLDVDTYVATWPLDGYGTKNICTRDEVRSAAEAAEAAAAPAP